MMEPQVEIIIPTYNRANLITRAIESVLTQDYGNLSIIVVDDGSSDDTADVLKVYESNPRIRVLKHECNRGVTAAKNTGLNNLSSGTKYFGILDSDDLLAPGAIRALVKEFERLGDSVSQVFGVCLDADSGEGAGAFDGTTSYVTYEDALCGNFRGEFWQLVRADILGCLRFEERAAGGESIVWHRLFKIAPGYLVQKVVRYYDRSGTDRVSRDAYDKITSERKMWAYQAGLDAMGADMRACCPERFAKIKLEVARWALLAGKRFHAFQALRDAVLADPSMHAAFVGVQLLLPIPLTRGLRLLIAQRKRIRRRPNYQLNMEEHACTLTIRARWYR